MRVREAGEHTPSAYGERGRARAQGRKSKTYHKSVGGASCPEGLFLNNKPKTFVSHKDTKTTKRTQKANMLLAL